MKSIKNSKGNETLIFAETFEFEAFDQIKRLCNFEPYLDSKIRVMPDAHAGKGCVVGTTMTVKEKITPNLVGVDIGCGMLTIRLKDREIDFSLLDEVIRKKVPRGFEIHDKPVGDFDFDGLKCAKHVDLNRAKHSIGSLGGGNHFIEAGKSEKTGDLFLIIHSGSRKLGGDVCKYYQDMAFQNVNEMTKIKHKLIKDLKKQGRKNEINDELKKIKKPSVNREMAFLEGNDFKDYMNDMEIVQRFAVLNRKTLADIIISEMGFTEESRFETIHNYIDFKRMILRKGAVSAEKGEKLIIPLNMRDGSLLCTGKGNPEWNYSAPHGAGRLMSRSKAKESIRMDEFKRSMKGIFTTSVTQSTIDEAPQAYKPAKEIIKLISEVVDIDDVILPVYNFKDH